MSDLKFGDNPPKSGKQARLTGGHGHPTPYHVEVWVDGHLINTRKFACKADAERFQAEEIAR